MDTHADHLTLREIGIAELPFPLREIPDPPKALWSIGSLPLPGTKALAVVGSRAISSYGRAACESLIAGLAGYPVSIVSGLALGTDGCAHRAALKAGLHTMAIPGSGLHRNALYPRAHVGLAQEILSSGGLLLSEHEPNHAARAYDFPSRNRIMAGMADAVLMIEAGDRSGTLITAALAGEYNRPLLCVPHRIGDPHGYGASRFLRLGATLVTETEHILEALQLQPLPAEQLRLPELSPEEAALYALLAEPKPRDAILRASTKPLHETLATLLSLELRGIIKEEFGNVRRAI